MFSRLSTVFLRIQTLLVIVCASSPMYAAYPSLSGTSYKMPPASIYTPPHAVAFSPDGLYLATANNFSSSVTIFSVESDGVFSLPCSYALPIGSSAPYSLAFSSNGAYLATANLTSNDVTVFTIGVGGVLTRAQ